MSSVLKFPGGNVENRLPINCNWGNKYGGNPKNYLNLDTLIISLPEFLIITRLSFYQKQILKKSDFFCASSNYWGTNLVFWIPDNTIMIKFDSNDVVELPRPPPPPIFIFLFSIQYRQGYFILNYTSSFR